MTETVVVIRTKAGDDILTILDGVVDNQLLIQQPFYARTNMTTGSITMVPYCPLSDEKFFKVDQSTVDFVAPASDDVTLRYMALIASSHTPDPSEEGLDDVSYNQFQLLPGNDTRH